MSFQLKDHPFPVSPEQAAFFQWLSDGRGSAVLDAVAGAAKTSSVIEGLQYLPEGISVQLFAFNTIIAKELEERMAALGKRVKRPFRGYSANTFHSIGLRAVKKFLGRQDIKPDGGKLRRLARAWLPEHEYGMYGDYICKLVGFARGDGIGALVPDAEPLWQALAQHHDLDLDHVDATEERAIELARGLLQRSNEAAKQGDIDFDDMLYCPLLWRCKLWQNDWVFCDESQDVSPVRRAICRLALKPGGRFVAVGDPCQSIFGFTGAEKDAMELLKKEFNCVTLKLSVSFRCSRAVVTRAQKHVPHIQAAPDAPEGETPDMGVVQALPMLDEHAAILCRNTAPLISMAYALIAVGKPCHVLGREIGQGLVKLIDKMNAHSIDVLERKLEKYAEREIAKLTAKGQEGKAQGVEDKVECVRVLISTLTENERKARNAVYLLTQKIDTLFQDGNSKLVLSTIHKAKGKEWHTVAVLKQELSPSRWARQDWQMEQEHFLEYVRDSRAKFRTIYLTDDHEALQRMKGRAA